MQIDILFSCGKKLEVQQIFGLYLDYNYSGVLYKLLCPE